MNSLRLTQYFRLLFIPQTQSRINGLATTFLHTIDNSTKIGPFLSTFGIQPYGSPIFAHIKAGNISGVQELFGAKRASGSDRDKYGRSLLNVRLL